MSRKKKRAPQVDDYGPHTGIGTEFAHLPPRVLRVRVTPGWRAAVEDQPGGARLVRFAGEHGEDSEAFKRVLGQWVRERMERGLPVPGCVVH